MKSVNTVKAVKAIAFSLMGAIVLLLVVASIVEKFKGTEFVARYFYTSTLTICLWVAAVVFSLWHLCNVLFVKTSDASIGAKLSQLGVFGLHFAFVLILAGALLTHLFGVQGAVELREGEATTAYIDKDHDYQIRKFPFSITLTNFQVLTYPGTDTPRDYVSTIIVDGVKGQVSMNKIFKYKGYRFYQSGYNGDGHTVVLLLNHDPWGIAVTYTGYLLLLLSILVFFFLPDTHFRLLVKRLKAELAGASSLRMLMVVLFVTSATYGLASPQTLPEQQSDRLGNLCVFYGGRLQPLSCLATDFTEKLYGKSSYQGMTAEQVYAGWLLMPYSWLDEPMLKLKSADRKLLGLKGRYATYNELFAAKNAGLQLSAYSTEKMALVYMLLHGELTRIYPYVTDTTNAASSLVWYSPSSDLQLGMPDEQWFFIRKSVDYIGELAFEKNYSRIDTVISKIAKYQQSVAGTSIPSERRFVIEQMFRRIHYSKPMAMAAVTIGLMLFLVYMLLLSHRNSLPKWLSATALWLMVVAELFLSVMLALRWYVSGHVPLSNGHETMQTLAWIAMLVALGASAQLSNDNHAVSRLFVLSAGWLIAGFALLVSMMTASNPQITPLMPVLQSPLLSIHVAVIMLSYALLFFIAINSLAALLSKNRNMQVHLLVSRLLLYPAVFLLTIGIFIGAIWANISWGRYWGWDPKEVWALITMLVYSLPLHSSQLSWLNKPKTFHLYCVVAFLTVLFTYFGVNFLLGGMHAYN
ncbi:MAG: cytochrome c biogenesis protein CcsA [Paludibacteraceae bacterium]|nr:cytochrome c biogenesis protein CcsA [Paludibacteraceae bacterium]